MARGLLTTPTCLGPGTAKPSSLRRVQLAAGTQFHDSPASYLRIEKREAQMASSRFDLTTAVPNDERLAGAVLLGGSERCAVAAVPRRSLRTSRIWIVDAISASDRFPLLWPVAVRAGREMLHRARV
jgi:hypothetical protein